MNYWLRLFVVMLVDLSLINVALYLAFVIRFDTGIPDPVFTAYLRLIPVASGIRLLAFLGCGLYPWSFRHAGFSEALQVIKAVAIGSLVTWGVARFASLSFSWFSVPLIEFLLCTCLMMGFRFSVRFKGQIAWRKSGQSIPVLIVGAGTTGVMVARELLHSESRQYVPVGFIDDSPHKAHQVIHGIRVLGTMDQLSTVVTAARVEEIVIAIPNAPGHVVRDVILSCQKRKVKFKIVPGLEKILSGKVELKKVRDVDLADLVGRKEFVINDDEIRAFINQQVVLVTGAGGSIGSELARLVAQFDPQNLILLDNYENDLFLLEMDLKKSFPGLHFKTIVGDVKDTQFLRHIFTRQRPQVVFHAAAHKHVPLMESNPIAAVKNNIVATRNLVDAAEHYGVDRFVLISTDKAVNPTNIMGATKRITEMLCQAKAKSGRTRFMSVRFGNVLGSNGSVVPIFKKQIEEGGPITITHPEIRRYFMTVTEAAQLVLQATALGKGGEVFVLDMGEQIKISELARNLVVLSGLDPDRDIEIRYIGLRPGEKLYEEMLHDTEHNHATRHDRIFIAQLETLEVGWIRKEVELLKRLADRMDQEAIIKKIRELVPSYKPQLPSQES